jgi:hypothetical protein
MTGLDAFITIARSTEALIRIGWLNTSSRGIPTPYACPAPSKMLAENVQPGVSVVNVLVVVLVTPCSVATALTVYRCETPSAHVECHAVPPAFIVPGTGPDGSPLAARVPPAGVTVTFDSVPVAAVTVTPAEGSALLAPPAGEIVTFAPGGAGLAAGLAAATPAGDPAALPPFAAGLTVSLRVPVHALASTASTDIAATAPSRLVTFVARTRMHLLSRPLQGLGTFQW